MTTTSTMGALATVIALPRAGRPSTAEHGPGMAHLAIDARPTAADMRAAAHARIDDGWAVHPVYSVTPWGVCNCSSRSGCISPGKHPVYTAWSTRPAMTHAEVEAHPGWSDAARYPDNIGGRTGAISGRIVEDEDDPGALAALDAAVGESPEPTREHRSGSGGRHRILRLTGPMSTKHPPGMDVLADGAQVVLEPSVTPKGAYTRANDLPEAEVSAARLEYLQTLGGSGTSTPAAPAVTGAQVADFIAAHPAGDRPALARAPLARFDRAVAAGESRHISVRDPLAQTAREVHAGLVPASALEVLGEHFIEAVTHDAATGATRDLDAAQREWSDLLAWAVAQVLTTDAAVVRAEVLGRVNPLSEEPPEDDSGLPREERERTPTTPAPTATAIPTGHETDVVEAPGSIAERAFEYLVQEEERRQAAREEATRRLRARQAGALAMPVPVRGDAFLAVADEPVEYRIDRILPIGSRALMPAPAKAGKTTFMGNLMRCLVDGDRFLDAFDVVPPEGGVLVIDDELDERMLRRWTREQGITHTNRLHFLALRGRVSTFNILDESTRALWAAAIRATGATFVVLDCLRPVLDALGLSEDKDAGRFLVALDALMTEAGVPEFVVVHHTGHAGERSRGDSRLVDWPDVLWRLVRQKDENGTADMAAPRFFTAFGRDVDVPEGLLTFAAEGRRLSYSATSRSAAAGAAVLPAVLALLDRHPEGLSGRAIEEAASSLGASRDAVRKALAAGRAEGSITCVPGPRRATLHVRSIPTVSRSL